MSKPIDLVVTTIGRLDIAEPETEGCEVIQYGMVIEFESAEELHQALNADAVKLSW